MAGVVLMAGITKTHELHERRKGRNMAVGILLGAFVILTMAVSVVKLSQPQSEDPRAPNYRAPIVETSE